MAKFQLGSVITNIAGSVGGTTFRRVPNGFSMFNKTKGTSKSRLLQNPRIPQIAQIFQQWSLLSDSERAGWSATALTVTFPDKFGVPKNLTGRELFSKLNIQLLPVGISKLDSTGFFSDYPLFSINGYNFNSPGGNYNIGLDSAFTSGTYMISAEVSNKKPLSPVFKSREVIQIADVESPDVNITFSTELLAKFPYIASGMWLSVYIQSINDFGMVSPYQYIIDQVS